MIQRTAWSRACTLCVLAGTTGAAAVAGPLDPPAGPVAPTYLTLAEVEPRTPVQSLPGDAEAQFVISEPGSYYLTGNVLGEGGKYGIKVTASGVTIDLMGFTMTGPAAGINQAAIAVTVGVSNLEVRNGTLTGWDGSGTHVGGVSGANAANSRAENLRTSGCSTGVRLGTGAVITGCVSELDGNGITCPGRAVISDCIVRSAQFVGIEGNAEASVIRGCLVDGAGNTGIVCGGGGVVEGCTARGATFYGIQMTGFHGRIVDCVAASNGHHGIVVGAGMYVSGCTARLNGAAIAVGSGIQVDGADCRIEGNNVLSNDRGITTGVAGSLVIRNSASGNGTAYSFAAGTVAAATVTAATIAASNNPHANYDF